MLTSLPHINAVVVVVATPRPAYCRRLISAVGAHESLSPSQCHRHPVPAVLVIRLKAYVATVRRKSTSLDAWQKKGLDSANVTAPRTKCRHLT